MKVKKAFEYIIETICLSLDMRNDDTYGQFEMAL